jgi:hypothetical protein
MESRTTALHIDGVYIAVLVAVRGTLARIKTMDKDSSLPDFMLALPILTVNSQERWTPFPSCLFLLRRPTSFGALPTSTSTLFADFGWKTSISQERASNWANLIAFCTGLVKQKREFFRQPIYLFEFHKSAKYPG